jgi:hypothetical protein
MIHQEWNTTIPDHYFSATMNFNLSITNTELEHLDIFLPEITSLRLQAYQGQKQPPSSPFTSSEDFKLFIAKEICKCHKLNDIWVNFLVAPLTKGQMTYQELTLLMIACYEHDNPTHNCPNTNKSHALISHSLLVLGSPISNPKFRNKPCGFNPPLIYAFFMQAYMHFWNKIINMIFIHTGKNWLEEEGFIDPFNEGNKDTLTKSITVGREVMEKVYKERRRFMGITYNCYRRRIIIWSSYT